MSTPFNGNPMQLIRAKCLDCSGKSFREVRLCVVFDCPLWFCRMGKRPSTFLRSGSPWANPAFVQAESDKQLRRVSYENAERLLGIPPSASNRKHNTRP